MDRSRHTATAISCSSRSEVDTEAPRPAERDESDPIVCTYTTTPLILDLITRDCTSPPCYKPIHCSTSGITLKGSIIRPLRNRDRVVVHPATALSIPSPGRNGLAQM